MITLLELDWAEGMVHAVCKQSICLLLMLQLSPSYVCNPDNSRKGWMPASQNSAKVKYIKKRGWLALPLTCKHCIDPFTSQNPPVVQYYYYIFLSDKPTKKIFWGGIWIFIIIKEMLRNRILLLNIKFFIMHIQKNKFYKSMLQK